MNTRVCLVLLALAALGCDRKADSPVMTNGAVPNVAPPPSGPTHYLALGDSYTCAQSVGIAQSYPMLLTRALRKSGIDLGRPTIIAVTGWTTNELSQGIDAVNPHGPYELVTLLIGVNNQFRHLPIDEFRTEFAALVQRSIGFAGNRPDHVIVLSIPDWGVMPIADGNDRGAIGHDIDRFNDVVRDESRKAAVQWIDITPISREATTQPALIAGDGLHPSGEQYGRWVDVLLPEILHVLSAAPSSRP